MSESVESIAAAPGTAPHTVTTFTTDSGSRYELDERCGQVRRISGAHRPTARQGADGAWRAFAALVGPVLGEPVMIVWSLTVESLTARMTVTSDVTALTVSRGCCREGKDSDARHR